MNPSSGFGSSFGQQQTSFGSANSAESSTRATGFGAHTGSTVFGTGSGALGSTNTTHSSSGFGSPSISTGFGSGSSGFGSTSGTAVFGSPGFGQSSGNVFSQTGSTSLLGSSTSTQARSVSSSGFGTGIESASSSSSLPGFATSSVFGAASTAGTSVFGSAGSVFGTVSKSSSSGGTSILGGGATVFGSGSQGSGANSGFGSSGFGNTSGNAGFGANSPGFPTGPSALGTSTMAGSGFGGGSSVFGSMTGPASASPKFATTQNSSVSAGSSVFGSRTQEVEGKTGTVGDSVVFSTRSSTFGSKTGSEFDQTKNRSQGLFGAPTTVFSQVPAYAVATTSATTSATSSSLFPARSISSTRAMSGFGSEKSSVAIAQVTDNVFSSAGSTSVFGSTQGASASSLFQKPETFVGKGGHSGLPPPSYTASVNQPTFGSTSASSSVFGGVPRSSAGKESLFDKAVKSVNKQETPEMSASSDKKALHTGMGAETSVFGSTNKPQVGQTFSLPAASSSIFGGFQGKPSMSAAHVPSSTASVFGGETSSVFRGAGQLPGQTQVALTSSVFGGKQSSQSPGQALFTAAVQETKLEPGKKENAFGVTSDQKQTDAPVGFQSATMAGRLGRGEETKQTKGRRLISRRMDAEQSSTGSVFGGKRDGSSGVPVGSRFPAAPGPSFSQKRNAAGDTEDGRDVKRGRTGEEQQLGKRSLRSPSTKRTPEKVKLRRSSSLLEDISSRTSVVCKGVSAKLNKGLFLRNHFSRFGKVKAVRPVPEKRYAIIQFETHESAALAKEHGKELPGQDIPMTIFWKSSTSEKSPTATRETAQAGIFERKRSSHSEGEGSLSQKYTLPTSVAEELASMGHNYRVLDRPSAVKKPVGESRKESSQSSRSRTPPPSSSSTADLPSSTARNLVKPAKVDAATVSGLRKIVAATTMEKVNVLDTRDKFLRQKLGKHTSGGIHAKAFVGTCPDMCPEKERLYREEVRRLSIYEIIPGSSTLTGSTSLVDHTRAVKEYSRSSADQDEPLPHELRPLPVLTLTMNYLLAEIADRGEDGKWAEWYDFLWNRTRSIRKEITQQQLCSQEVVDLLEKCVRFHAYCSERLCMEDMMVFDSKINDENLTKCLQTLKELYADMENKHGLFCPNEAEFRAYIVLMNLNEGDTLREVQQLRPDVRASPEIGFAVKAYTALNANNYVRFFRLVKSASFLSGCILHRYFNQIRARGLQIILRSHTAGQKKVEFPLIQLIRLLAFESEEEVKDFYSYYGLLAEGNDLVLDRSAYVEPESSIPFWRAVGLVESKRKVSVGEVINGGSLQPVRLPTPQCSFNEQGLFIGSVEGLPDSQETQDKVMPFTVRSSAKPPLQTSPLQQFDVTDDPGTAAVAPSEASPVTKQLDAKSKAEILKLVTRDLFFDVIDEMAKDIAGTVITRMKTYGDDVSHDIISCVTSDLAREMSIEVIDSERARQNQLAAAEKREREEQAAADVLASIVDSTVDDQVQLIAQAEIEEVQAELEAQRRERCTVALQSELLEEVTTEMSLQVASEVHQVDVVERLQLLTDLQKAVELKRVSQWLFLWRKALKTRQRQKRAMLDFPCAPPMQTPKQRLQSMYPDRPEHLSPLVPGKSALLVNHRAQMTLLSPLETEQRSLTLTAHLSLASLLNSLRQTRAWQPLNLGSLLRIPISQGIQQWPQHVVKEFKQLGVQWKLLVTLPGQLELEEDESNDGLAGHYKHPNLLPVLKQWICAKFTHGDSSGIATDVSQRNVLGLYSTDLTGSGIIPSKLRLSICVRNVPEFSRTEKNKLPTAEQGHAITKGTSAILFLLPHSATDDDTKWLASRLRLARLLEAKPTLPATPLVLLLPCSANASTSLESLTSEVVCRMGIENFQDQGLLSGVSVVELPVRSGQHPDVAVASPVLQTQISEAVKYLASRVPEPPDLRCERLGDIVEDTLAQHFFTPVLQDQKSRQQRSKLHQAPNTLIGLYNNVLDHIAMALTSPALQDISWPAPELQHLVGTKTDWNSKKHLADIYELVANLRLPWFHYKDQSATEWRQVCQDVWTFINAVVKKRCDSAVSLTTRISRLLAQTCLQFENVCSLTQNEDYCTPTYVNAPWTDIILACVDFRLQRLHNWKEEEEEVGGNLEIFFEEEDLEEFEPPASWIQALLDTEDMESQRIEDTVEQAAIIHFASKPIIKEDNFTNNCTHSNIKDSENNDTSDETICQEKSLLAAAQERNELPENIRSALDASENLLLHVREERQKTLAFENYLEKALRGGTAQNLDMDVSAIFPTPSIPAVPRTLASSLSTPSILPAPRLSGGASSQVHERCFAHPDIMPRRLAFQDSGAAAPEDVEMEEDVHDVRSVTQQLPLSEALEQFKEDLQAQRYASELFEKRLQSFLESY